MTKDKKLVIVGAGEMAMIAYEYFTHDSSYEVVGFSVERDYLQESSLYDKPIVAFDELNEHFPAATHDAFVAIPASQLNRLRTRLYLAVKAKGYRCATYISSRAFVWHNAEIGENCFIFENNTVQPFVKIGNNVILWSGNHIGHRSIIGDNSFLSSHVVVSGYCRIGDSCFLGVNSTLNDHVEIPRDCIIASGALLSKSVQAPEKIYYGSPAKEMPKKSAFSVQF
ncbi:UDP-4-amino-4, 6-dideoxy-N-acetyl-alpha-D-glucosamine N-acetyltransferase [Legionella massiliensis]|uniref:UDP-4-amino-4, 6-dideoxy-N-acetyl-alpha-D-glucosamine N-acetyltransferase n=1 Tax=Legionella massiliensis TaxID=1034943 RepID=A0A078L0N1_9GAMM|nr:acetyltransferase [Legionella massiliensis]CDZ78807.1 UDP-4-amino-4, 6-dideoxy-N-acetyl-alpha-D-glucosamine N-acetyltransferase [Legionella massiliensis]CEE14545.1 UDP-N-acetylbacillosamine N-acetyltransferase [Legionella massiliensis]